MNRFHAKVFESLRESPELLISSMIEARYGRSIARIRQEVQGLCLPKALASELRAETGSAALKIIRKYPDAANEMFEVSVSTHPADRFTFAMGMTRSRS